MQLFSERTGKTLCPELSIASGIWRFIGLMGKKNFEQSEALLIPQCNHIHTFFMRFPIGVVFLDETMRVLRIDLQHPWAIGRACLHASMVVEVHPTIVTEQRIQLGDMVKVW